MTQVVPLVPHPHGAHAPAVHERPERQSLFWLHDDPTPPPVFRPPPSPVVAAPSLQAATTSSATPAPATANEPLPRVPQVKIPIVQEYHAAAGALTSAP